MWFPRLPPGRYDVRQFMFNINVCVTLMMQHMLCSGTPAGYAYLPHAIKTVCTVHMHLQHKHVNNVGMSCNCWYVKLV